MTSLRRRAGVFALGAVALLATACLAFTTSDDAAPRAGAQSLAAWLVDRARDHALTEASRRSELDMALVDGFLQAALRVDPRQRDALAWRYELAALGGRADDARRLLADLAAIGPDEQQALARWLETGPADATTAEGRQRWLERELERATSPFAVSLVRTHLARLAHEQGATERAREQLAAAQSAYPDNPLAALLAVEMAPPDSPVERLRALLNAVRLHPVNADLVWRVGRCMDELELHNEAMAFYDQALYLHDGPVVSDARVPPDKLLVLAENAVSRGNQTEALRRVTAALLQSPTTVEYLYYATWLNTVADRPVDASITRQTLANLFVQVREPSEWPVQLVAQAAWFYATVEIRPQRALELSQAAFDRAPGDPYTRRVHAAALSINDRAREARELLAPIAADDAFAAAMLARLLKADGDEAGAAEVIGRIKNPPRFGPTADQLREFSGWLPASRPAAERFKGVQEAFAAVRLDSTDYPRNPPKYLSASMQLDSLGVPSGDPWTARFELTNNAPFPLVLGTSGSVNPTFIVSFQSEGDRPRAFPYLFSVAVDGPMLLGPGETIQVQRSLRVGPLRRFSRMTPQQSQRITVQTIFDPMPAPAGGFVTGPSQVVIRPVTFTRAASIGADRLNALLAGARGDSPAVRRRSLEVLGDLLGEQQRLARGAPAYNAQRVNTSRIRGALLASLAGEDWETRAAALEALMVCGLDAEMVAAVQRCLEDPHWLVRMMSVRLLARQGAAFAATAQSIAQRDPDELVRAIAQACLGQPTGGERD